MNKFMKELVSIILPVYNGENTITDTINSVLNQSYKKFQLIIINDGSKDNTDNICKEFEDNRINYFYIENNGVSNARNFALKKAKGKYIMFIDSDDLYSYDYIEKMVKTIENGYELICSGYINFGKNTKSFFPNESEFENKLKYIEKLQENYLFNQIWNKIYIKEIIIKNNLIFDSNLSIAEDWDFNINYLNKITKYSVCKDSFYKYRVTNTGLGFKYRDDANIVKLRLIDKMKELFVNDNCANCFISNSYIRQYYSYFSNIVDKRNKDEITKKSHKINEIINSVDYEKRLNEIKCYGFMNKVLYFFLNRKNIFFITILAYLANLYDRINKRKKFGL